jgi:hypothetical protein
MTASAREEEGGSHCVCGGRAQACDCARGDHQGPRLPGSDHAPSRGSRGRREARFGVSYGSIKAAIKWGAPGYGPMRVAGPSLRRQGRMDRGPQFNRPFQETSNRLVRSVPAAAIWSSGESQPEVP